MTSAVGTAAVAGKSDKKKRKKRKKRNLEDLKQEGCRGCPSLCCRDLCMRILKPETEQEIAELRWQVRFDTVRIFITSNRWHLLIDGRCMYLQDDNLCAIYEDRPDKCRRHNAPDCERYGEFWDELIETPEELDAWFERERKRRAKRRRKAARRRAAKAKTT
jgi:Fe-S-cluster containining protein